MVPKSINKELSKRSQKYFSKSSIIFNGELTVSPTGIPLTREEVRNALGTENIDHILNGIGFWVIGDNFEIE